LSPASAHVETQSGGSSGGVMGSVLKGLCTLPSMIATMRQGVNRMKKTPHRLDPAVFGATSETQPSFGIIAQFSCEGLRTFFSLTVKIEGLLALGKFV